MNRAMIGTCAVGIVIVDGPAGTSAAFTDTEKLDVALAFSHGWDALYVLADKYAPARPHLLLLADLKVATLTLDPATIAAPSTRSPSNADYSSRETPWRDAALQALGFSTGTAGISAYNQNLLTKSWSLGVTPTSAYVAFVTKYHAAWMAYTHGSQAYMVYQIRGSRPTAISNSPVPADGAPIGTRSWHTRPDTSSVPPTSTRRRTAPRRRPSVRWASGTATVRTTPRSRTSLV